MSRSASGTYLDHLTIKAALDGKADRRYGEVNERGSVSCGGHQDVFFCGLFPAPC